MLRTGLTSEISDFTYLSLASKIPLVGGCQLSGVSWNFGSDGDLMYHWTASTLIIIDE